MLRIDFVFAVLAAVALTAPDVSAMGSDSSPKVPTARENFENGKKAVYAAKYDRAIRLMNKVVAEQPKNADAHNYIGFAYRKMGKLQQAAASYQKVFAINANHKGALEYQGELFLKQNNLAGAQANLAKLTGLCPSGYKEQVELKRAIADYKTTMAPKRGS